MLLSKNIIDISKQQNVMQFKNKSLNSYAKEKLLTPSTNVRNSDQPSKFATFKGFHDLDFLISFLET